MDLEPARDVLQADGVDIELVRMDGETAHLRLKIVDAACAECVLPRHMLEPVVLDLLPRRSTHARGGVHRRPS